MRKAIYIVTMLSLALSMSAMPALAATSVGTGLTRDTSGGALPLVKAKWEANPDRYTDDSKSAGAQFTASGVYNGHKTIALCAIVEHPEYGLDYIDNVYADVFYPEDIKLGDSHVALPEQSGLGCGKLMQEDTLKRLSKNDGLSLFCTQVQNSNNNLPTFAEGKTSSEWYSDICKLDGQLQKETAAVYCGEKRISYEDPSGNYKVWAVAQDKNGGQNTLENQFTYLETTAFETDFTSVSYGNVKLNSHKIINGDLTWDALGQGKASVRNVGNTRLAMKVTQDDMDLGMSDGIYNVKYDARVGSGAAFANYYPFATPKLLADELDLSELDEMDFSVEISKFPPTNPGPGYTGDMTLTAIKRAHLSCTN